MNYYKHTSILLITIVFTSCRNYKEITKKPERSHVDVELPSFESSFNLALKADLSDLEVKLNEVVKNGYSHSDESTFEYESWIKTKDPLYNPDVWIKTKDPLYHPNEWFKTKDPLYHPRKWIEKWGIKTKDPLYHPRKWIKTKDPLYHPNEWINTKNPLYHPNEWIETRGPSVTIGYRYDVDLKLKEKISISYIDNNTLKISVPISFEGSVGLQGSVPAALSLDKKKFDGEIEFYINTSISITPDWCPKADLKVTHSWISNPQLEIIDNVYISLTGITDKYLKKFENEIGNVINKQIKCEAIRNAVDKKWKYYGFNIPSLANEKNYQLNINPIQASLSRLKVYQDTLAMYVGIKANVSINDGIINTTNSLPLLEEQTETANEIKASIPLLLKYIDIENTANQYLKDNHVILKPDIILNQKATLELNEMSIYPNKDKLVIGVKLNAKLPGNILPVSGWVYLVGKPVMVGGKKFEIQNIEFSMTVDNKFYPMISTLFKPLIIQEIQKQTTRDFTDRIDGIKKKILEKYDSFSQDEIGFSINDLDFGIYDIVLDSTEIAIIGELSSKLNIFLKTKSSGSN